MKAKGALLTLVALALVAAGAFFALHRSKPTSPAAARAPQPQAPTLNEVSLPGLIQAKTVLNIPAPSDGIIERFMADVGEDVFEGELLAEIKNTKLDSAAETAENDAARAQAKVAGLESALSAARLEASRARADALRTRSDFERSEKVYTREKLLFAEGATPRLVFEKARDEYEQLKADAQSFEQLAAAAESRLAALTKDVDTARKNAQSKAQSMDEAKADLGAGEVRCSVNGVVVGRHGQAGEPITRQVKDLFQIGVDLGTLQVVASLDPRLSQRVRPGQGAQIQIAEAPSAIIGTVRDVKPGQVTVEFVSPSPSIKPGLTAQLKLPLS